MSDGKKTNPDRAVDESIDAERIIPPDTGAPETAPAVRRPCSSGLGASTLASAAADLDATGGANSLDRAYSGPCDEDDEKL